MTTGTALALRVSFLVHDAAQAECTAANALIFVNDALHDLDAAGCVLPLEEDESLSLSASTYAYSLPATFAYVSEVRIEGTTASVYDILVPKWQYRFGYDGAAAKVIFDPNWFTLTAAKKIKIIGQQRLSAITGAGTVTVGIESFLRERAAAYLAMHLTQGGSELAEQRQRFSEVAWNRSEVLLSHMSEEYRIVPGSKPVPGR